MSREHLAGFNRHNCLIAWILYLKEAMLTPKFAEYAYSLNRFPTEKAHLYFSQAISIVKQARRPTMK